MKLFFRAALSVALVTFSSVALQAATPGEDDYSFEPERRINAHGDEFMALAQTSDGRYLIVGAESGKVIIWSIAERRILKQLDQGSPVHCVVALNDADTFVAGGGPHIGPINRTVIRKWRISSGTSEEWKGITDGSIFSLAFDSKTELIVADTLTGKLGVWNSSNGALVTKRSFAGPASGLAIDGKEIYRSDMSLTDGEDAKPNSIVRFRIDQPNSQPTQLTKRAGVWFTLRISPDRRFLAARRYDDPGGETVVIRDLSSQKDIGSFKAHTFAWAADGDLVLFDPEVATTRISIDAQGRVSSAELLKGAQWHQAGSPANMTGRVVSADGSKAWEVFQLGPSLVELNLNQKTFDELYSMRSYLYVMEVREQLNLLATGGDDGFVRVRKLADSSLMKEFKVARGVPQGVALPEDGRHVVFSSSDNESPTRISVGDLVSGETRTLLEVPEPFVRVRAVAGGFIYNQANKLVLANWSNGETIREYEIEGELAGVDVSANGEWLVAANEANTLFRFAIKDGHRTRFATNNPHRLYYLAISNEGRYVYSTEFEAILRQWDMQTSAMKELGEIRGEAHTLTLSRDEKEIALGGNHRDVAVYDIATGERRLYFQISAADFYVTTVWLGGDRLLFSTDAGVLFDGRVKR